MTMQRILVCGMAAMLATTMIARADHIDLASYRCKQFVATDKDTAGLILMWLNGYYTEESASPIVDFDIWKNQGIRLRDYCGKNPESSLIEAAEKTIGR